MFPPKKPGVMYLYALVDPDTQRVRYVGRTVQPWARYRAHMYGVVRRKSHRTNWIARLRAVGKRPIFRVLEEAPQDGWEVVEQRWIATMRACGEPLTNVTAGGDGIAMLGQPLPATHRAHIAAALRGKKRAPFSEEALRRMGKAQLGKAVPAERRARISATHRSAAFRQQMDAMRALPEHRERHREASRLGTLKAWADEAVRERHREAMAKRRGIPLSEEHRRAVSAAQRGRPGRQWTEADRQRASMARRGRKPSDTARQRLSESIRAVHDRDPSYRQRVAEGVRRTRLAQQQQRLAALDMEAICAALRAGALHKDVMAQFNIGWRLMRVIVATYVPEAAQSSARRSAAMRAIRRARPDWNAAVSAE